MATYSDRQRAMARQGKADFDAYFSLKDSTLPTCQKLQFLQMACEKLSKAYFYYLHKPTGEIKKSHSYTKKYLPDAFSEYVEARGLAKKTASALLQTAKLLASEIELLSPSVYSRGGVAATPTVAGRRTVGSRNRGWRGRRRWRR